MENLKRQAEDFVPAATLDEAIRGSKSIRDVSGKVRALHEHYLRVPGCPFVEINGGIPESVPAMVIGEGTWRRGFSTTEAHDLRWLLCSVPFFITYSIGRGGWPCASSRFVLEYRGGVW